MLASRRKERRKVPTDTEKGTKDAQNYNLYSVNDAWKSKQTHWLIYCTIILVMPRQYSMHFIEIQCFLCANKKSEKSHVMFVEFYMRHE
jgi:hypothetical protein